MGGLRLDLEVRWCVCKKELNLNSNYVAAYLCEQILRGLDPMAGQLRLFGCNQKASRCSKLHGFLVLTIFFLL